jgi:hypothetical protein
VRVGDEIKDAQNVYYVLKSVEQIWRGDEFVAYKCNAEKATLHADRASTSGSWHTDSGSAVTDTRYRTKVWLTTYITGVTGDYAIMFSGLDYPLQLEFSDKGLEVVCAVDNVQSTPEYTYNHYPYKFNESVDIQLYALDTATYTAVNLLERFEQCIREVATDYPIGSIREITTSKPMRVDAGGQTMWQLTVNLKYTRTNDDYVADYPRLTWGPSAAPSGTFKFPNVTNLRYPSNEEADVWLHPPGYTTSISQAMGDLPLNIEITCDLDIEHTDLTWKRPQTSTPKTDTVNWEIFWENKHQEGIDQEYHTLTISATGPAIKVRLVSKPDVNGNILTLTFREYTTATASGGTVQTRYALT